MLFYIHPLCRIELIRLRFFPQRWQTVVYVIAVFNMGAVYTLATQRVCIYLCLCFLQQSLHDMQFLLCITQLSYNSLVLLYAFEWSDLRRILTIPTIIL